MTKLHNIFIIAENPTGQCYYRVTLYISSPARPQPPVWTQLDFFEVLGCGSLHLSALSFLLASTPPHHHLSPALWRRWSRRPSSCSHSHSPGLSRGEAATQFYPSLGYPLHVPQSHIKQLIFSSVKVPSPTLFYKVSATRALVDVWLLLFTPEKGSTHGPPRSHSRHRFSPQSWDRVHFINHITNCRWN